MAKGKIKAGKLPVADNKIVAGTPNPTTTTLSFSFQYIDPAHAKFGFSGQTAAYFCKVLERLKDISSLTSLEFTTNRNAALKSHCIEWKRPLSLTVLPTLTSNSRALHLISLRYHVMSTAVYMVFS